MAGRNYRNRSFRMRLASIPDINLSIPDLTT